MTNTRTVQVTCPSCHAQGEFTVYKSINTKESPALKEKVRDGSLFQFTCPACGAKTTVDYPFLYHQPEDHYMINYGKLEDGAKALEMLRGKGVALKDWAAEMEKTTRPYVLRAVDDRLAFREKLFIFDAGLDDRLVEIYKFMVCYQYAAAGKAQGGEHAYFYGLAGSSPCPARARQGNARARRFPAQDLQPDPCGVREEARGHPEGGAGGRSGMG